MVSGTGMLAGDPLKPVSCNVPPAWIRFACPAHPTDTRLIEIRGIWRQDQQP